jgi:hypothetical protein
MTSHPLIRLVIPLIIGGTALSIPLGATPAQAQGDTATQAVAAARPSSRRVSIAKAVFGDAGVIVNARGDGYIEVAAAGPSKTILLQLRALAARAWVDSTARMLRARPRRSTTPRTYRSDIDEAGTSGTMALTRKVTRGESEYALFFSDDPLGGFTVPIERSEADVFVAQIRRAVAQAAKMLEPPDSTTSGDSASSKAAKPATKPAAKRPARQSPTTPANPGASKTGKPATPPPAKTPATQPPAKGATPA